MWVCLEYYFRGADGILQVDLSVIGIVLRRRVRVMVVCIQPGIGRVQVQGMGDAFDLSRMHMPGMLMRCHLPIVAMGILRMEMVKRNQEKVEPQKENQRQQHSR